MVLRVYNRQTHNIEVEKVYGDKLVSGIYGTPIGRIFSHLLATSPLSILYGKWQDSQMSAKVIPSFVKDYNINLNDYLPEEGLTEANPYSTFNNFFIRKFKPEKRQFDKNNAILPAFSEGRYFGHASQKKDLKLPVKGNFLNSKNLLESSTWEKTFLGGPVLISRLCPVDYHRFHFPDDGQVLDQYRIAGEYHSVNPLALKVKPDIFITNERSVSILDTANFGKLAYIEVGAMCVGKIVQSHRALDFKRGDEKGYFLFGGSTVIVLGEPGIWAPSSDIIENTQNGIEVLINLGQEVAFLFK